VYGYSVDTILMCDDIDTNTKNPIGVGEIYLSDSGYIYCWVNFTDVKGPLAIKFEWFGPGQDLVRSNIIHTVSGTFPLFSVSNLLKVEGTSAASKLGKWTVLIFVDDVYVAETNFFLSDYSTFIDDILQLEAKLVESTIVKDQLFSQYDFLQGEHNELINSYNNLSHTYILTLAREKDQNESVRTLISENEELSETLIQLQSTYDELLTDYNERNRTSLMIESELEKIRNVLIISIVIIMILLIFMSKR
jgi:hypothetical protein